MEEDVYRRVRNEGEALRKRLEQARTAGGVDGNGFFALLNEHCHAHIQVYIDEADRLDPERDMERYLELTVQIVGGFAAIAQFSSNPEINRIASYFDPGKIRRFYGCFRAGKKAKELEDKRQHWLDAKQYIADNKEAMLDLIGDLDANIQSDRSHSPHEVARLKNDYSADMTASVEVQRLVQEGITLPARIDRTRTLLPAILDKAKEPHNLSLPEKHVAKITLAKVYVLLERDLQPRVAAQLAQTSGELEASRREEAAFSDVNQDEVRLFLRKAHPVLSPSSYRSAYDEIKWKISVQRAGEITEAITKAGGKVVWKLQG